MSRNHNEEFNPFPATQWIAWFAATVGSAIAVVIFLYMNFVTKESFVEYKSGVERRLDRIEVKLDQLIDRK